MKKTGTDSALNVERHQRACSAYSHSQREEIESAFVSCRSPEEIAQEFGLPDWANVYQHAHAMKLFEKRRPNTREALEKIIERAGEVEVSASARRRTGLRPSQLTSEPSGCHVTAPLDDKRRAAATLRRVSSSPCARQRRRRKLFSLGPCVPPVSWFQGNASRRSFHRFSRPSRLACGSTPELRAGASSSP